MRGVTDATGAGLEVFVLGGFGEIVPGDDLAALILAAATQASAGAGASAGPSATVNASAGQTTVLRDGDILAVTSKIVSKAEGRIVPAADREQAISDETVRVVASRVHPNGVTRIVENRQGLVMAAAGVDASNTAEGTVLLLPVDPDASARALCATLRKVTGLRLGVIITDTAGRVWRDGQTDIAIGAAGVLVLDDLRGTTDAFGHRLAVTAAAAGDEIAGAADLVKGKTSQNPVAVVRGLGRLVVSDTDADSDATGDDATDTTATDDDATDANATDAPTSAALAARGARILQRDSANDMFRLGSAEAHAEGYAAGFEAGLAQGQAAGFAAGLAAARAHSAVDEPVAEAPSSDGEHSANEHSAEAPSSDAPGSEPA